MKVIDFAKRHGVSRVAVYKWIKAGIIDKIDGQIDETQADAQVAAYRGKGPAVPYGQKGNQKADYDRELAKAKSEMARMKADEQAGQLLTLAEVEAEVTRGFDALRSRVVNLGARLALRVSAMSDPKEVRTLIDIECRELLADSEAEILS